MNRWAIGFSLAISELSVVSVVSEYTGIAGSCQASLLRASALSQGGCRSGTSDCACPRRTRVISGMESRAVTFGGDVRGARVTCRPAPSG